MVLKAVIFDCDGLLVDTESAEFQSWQEVFTLHGVSLPLDLWQEGIGSVTHLDPYELLEAYTGSAIDRAIIHAERSPRNRALVREKTLLPGVLKAIAKAQSLGLAVAVASSSPAYWVQWVLEEFGIGSHFETIVTADDVKLTKPDPEIYTTTLSRLKVQPLEAIALEDSLNGVKAARGAGIFCAAIPNQMTAALDFSVASMRLNSLEELDLDALMSQFASTQET